METYTEVIDGQETVVKVYELWTKDQEANMLELLQQFGTALFAAFNQDEIEEVENIKSFLTERFARIWKLVGENAFDRYVEANTNAKLFAVKRIHLKKGRAVEKDKVNLFAVRQ